MNADLNSFRHALGSFATGVTIVTTMDDAPVGVTASSFNSVSLDPPLVLWSLAKSSRSIQAFRAAGHFAVHVLGAHQDDLSTRFATAGGNKFDGLAWSAGATGSPLLPDFCALFECRTMHMYEGGDHDIFVGEVIGYERRDVPPLLFHKGAYAEARSRAVVTEQPTVALEEGRFTEDFLLYLLSRAHFESARHTRSLREENALSESDFMVLCVLSMSGPMALAALQRELDHTGLSPCDQTIAELSARGLVAGEETLAMTDKGRALFIPMLARAKAVEDEIVGRFTAAEIGETKAVLRRLIDIAREVAVD